MAIVLYIVVERDEIPFGRGMYMCHYVVDEVSDISTLPTSSTKGTGGLIEYDNEVCSPGSCAYVVGAEANDTYYMLNCKDEWILQ